MIVIGIDNGSTGQIGFISSNDYKLIKTPVLNTLSYTKTVNWINRVDYLKFKEYIFNTITELNEPVKMVFLERPMINPTRFKNSILAARALEATIICLEELNLPYCYIDSKEWQPKILPIGLKTEQLKKASLEVGKRKYPNMTWSSEFKDADGFHIAQHGYNKIMEKN